MPTKTGFLFVITLSMNEYPMTMITGTSMSTSITMTVGERNA